ncbi:hypothetical protein BJ165DRAFT_1491514 [Panaeolus papilionaceus]|nr:hypothetical protein BJ165DRAFT_1491514 [Panaeolus papilionaceus]
MECSAAAWSVYVPNCIQLRPHGRSWGALQRSALMMVNLGLSVDIKRAWVWLLLIRFSRFDFA